MIVDGRGRGRTGEPFRCNTDAIAFQSGCGWSSTGRATILTGAATETNAETEAPGLSDRTFTRDNDKITVERSGQRLLTQPYTFTCGHTPWHAYSYTIMSFLSVHTLHTVPLISMASVVQSAVNVIKKEDGH